LAKFGSAIRAAGFALRQPVAFRAVRQARRQKLTYLGWNALLDLSEAVLSVERRAVPGDLLEAGCALGGSALVMAASKKPTRPFYIYDTFEMIPPPSTQDGEDAQARYQKISAGESAGIAGEAYYGYLENLKERVTRNFTQFKLPLEENHILLVQGLFQDTLHPEAPVALAHLDCDWYESVMTCLERIVPRLSAGGVLVVDDYFDWSGCRKAVDEYFADKRAGFRFEVKSRLHIQREA
jgi:hypothetical protein